MWLVLFAAATAVADDTVEINSIGLDGYFAAGRPTQLNAEVTSENGGEFRVEVLAPDPHGNRVRFQSEPVQLQANKATIVPILFRVGQLGATIEVQLVGEDGAVASTSRRFPKNSGLISPSVTIVGSIGQPRGLTEYLDADQIFFRYDKEDEIRKRRKVGETVRTRDEALKLTEEVADRIRETADFESERANSEKPESGSMLTSDLPDEVVETIRKLPTDGSIGIAETSQGFYVVRRNRVTDEFIQEQAKSRLVIDLSPENMPVEPRSLSAMQVLVVGREFEKLTQEQSDCIREWVRFGGHLVVSIPGDLESYRNSAIGKHVQEWLPIAAEQSQLAELPDLEGFTDNIAPVPLNRTRIAAARVVADEGRVLVRGTDGPIIVQTAAGFGRVSLIGLDTTSGPLAKWDAMPLLMRRIVYDEKRTVREQQIESSAIGHNGITDLATQLHASQANFSEVKRYSSWIAMGLILLYMIAIGPLDYLIVHRLLRRPRLTWITFPLMVIGACVAGVMLARSSNGDEMRVNQTAIIDIDASSTKSGRVRSWYSVYTPVSRRSKIAATPGADMQQLFGLQSLDTGRLSWDGIPENVFGGMLRTGGASLGGVPYSSDKDEVSGIPIAVWSTTSLTSSWTGDVKPVFQSQLKSTPTGQLTGSFSHNLDQPIRNWLIAYGRNAFYPDPEGAAEIAPGEWRAGDHRSTFLASLIKGERAVEVIRRAGEGGESTKLVSDAYDALERDPYYIVRILTLHTVAGGSNYTGLTNSMLSELDCTHLTKLNRAVLIGEIDTVTADLSLDGEPLPPTSNRSIIRVVLPVAPAESN